MEQQGVKIMGILIETTEGGGAPAKKRQQVEHMIKE